MSRKHLIGLFSLVLLASACASTSTSAPPDLTGQWIPQKVDFLSDAGRSPSMAIDADGLPHLAYLGLNEKLAKGEIAPARPLSLPVIPAVLTSDLSKDGLWEHGSVVATSDLADPLPLSKADVVALALDADGNKHVAYSLKGDLNYASEESGEFGTPEKIASGTFSGLSITVDDKGTPWVSWIEDGKVMVATLKGTKWSTQTVGPAGDGSALPATTSIKAGGGGLVLAFTGPEGPMLATQRGGGWSTQAIDPGAGGFGLSLALDKDGNPNLAYYTKSGDVLAAAGSGSATTAVGHAGTKHPAGWLASIAVDDKGTRWVAWYDANQDEVRLGSDKDGSFKQLDIFNTEGGELPQVGVAPNGSTVWVSWYDRVNADLDIGELGVNGAPQVALAVVSPPASPSAGPTGGGGATCPKTANVTLTAPSGAATDGFEETKLTGTSPIELCFINDDAGVGHNVAVYTDDPLKDPSAKTIFDPGAETIDSGSTVYDVGKVAAGSYFYHCVIHPTTMTGTLTVK